MVLMLREAERKTCRLLRFQHLCINSRSYAGIHCESHNCAGLLFGKNEHRALQRDLKAKLSSQKRTHLIAIFPRCRDAVYAP